MGCTLALHELALQRSICAECHALLLWRGIDTLPRTGFGQSFYALPEGASPSLKSVLRHFAVEVSESNLALPRLLTACSAARLGQGDPLDVAVCFAALCRALNIRARLVRSFWLGPAQGASIAAQQLEKPSQQLWQRLTKGGLSDEKALSIALEIEATGSCVAETSLLAYAGAVHKRDEKNCANITCWVECFDVETGDWLAVDTVGPFLAAAPVGLWMRPDATWICAADDALQGQDFCELTDQTERYVSRAYLRRRQALGNWDTLQFWWQAVLRDLSGDVNHVRCQSVQPKARPKARPKAPKERPKMPQRASKVQKKLKVIGARRSAHRKRKLKTTGMTGFPSIEPFKTNALKLQEFIKSCGLLPWPKSENPEERMLGRFLQNVKTLKARGRLKAFVLECLFSRCPLWHDMVEAVPVVPTAPIEFETEETEEPRSERSATRFSWVRASLGLARCKSADERRALLRKMQLDFHPDKNLENPAAWHFWRKMYGQCSISCNPCGRGSSAMSL
ncbi:unnamed protein product [Durusdinium trenchii]|uniref:Transglutaminase-like domain-containing protein n=1 Tax=Durusdinium trenchii TaxID=1381693 RepID=A0ABP0LYD3_9DINO